MTFLLMILASFTKMSSPRIVIRIVSLLNVVNVWPSSRKLEYRGSTTTWNLTRRSNSVMFALTSGLSTDRKAASLGVKHVTFCVMSSGAPRPVRFKLWRNAFMRHRRIDSVQFSGNDRNLNGSESVSCESKKFRVGTHLSTTWK